MKQNLDTSQLKQLLALNKTEQVFERLNAFFSTINDKKFANKLVLLEGRWEKLKDDQIKGLDRKEDNDREHRNINNNLLMLIDELKNPSTVAFHKKSTIKEDGKIPVQKVDSNSVYKGENGEYYIERRIEQRVFDLLDKSDSLIKIKAPAQYGKSHVMGRLIRRAKEQDFEVLTIDFSGWGGSDYDDFSAFFRKFCDQVFYQKNKERRRQQNRQLVAEYWQSRKDDFSPKDITDDFFINHIYEKDKKLLLAINDIDKLFGNQKLASEFCLLIRFWFNSSQTDENYINVKFVLTYALDPTIAIKDLNQSPFNVGREPIVLNQFSRVEVEELYKQYFTKLDNAVLEFILDTFGGHPYLTKLCLSQLVETMSLEKLKDSINHVNSSFQDHLKSLSRKVKFYDLKKAIQLVLAKNSISDEDYFKLAALGIIKGNKGQEEFSNKFYKDFFKTYR